MKTRFSAVIGITIRVHAFCDCPTRPFVQRCRALTKGRWVAVSLESAAHTTDSCSLRHSEGNYLPASSQHALYTIPLPSLRPIVRIVNAISAIGKASAEGSTTDLPHLTRGRCGEGTSRLPRPAAYNAGLLNLGLGGHYCRNNSSPPRHRTFLI